MEFIDTGAASLCSSLPAPAAPATVTSQFPPGLPPSTHPSVRPSIHHHAIPPSRLFDEAPHINKVRTVQSQTKTCSLCLHNPFWPTSASATLDLMRIRHRRGRPVVRRVRPFDLSRSALAKRWKERCGLFQFVCLMNHRAHPITSMEVVKLSFLVFRFTKFFRITSAF